MEATNFIELIRDLCENIDCNYCMSDYRRLMGENTSSYEKLCPLWDDDITPEKLVRFFSKKKDELLTPTWDEFFQNIYKNDPRSKTMRYQDWRQTRIPRNRIDDNHRISFSLNDLMQK